MTKRNTNIKQFFLGLGSSDAKTNVSNLAELSNQVAELGDFYQDNDIVWVVGEKKFYTINKATNPPYEVFEAGGGGGSSNGANIFYGKEDDILDFLRGVTSKAPGLLGYSDGDGFISSSTVSAGATTIEKFDVYEADIPMGEPGAFIFVGSIKGADGADGTDGNDGNTGPQGDKGDKGDPFVVDEQGLFADRDTDCASKPVGYSFLATDQGLLYFKEADPCVWSAGIPFGKGDPGETTFISYVRAQVGSPPTKPADNEVSPGIGWFDTPPPATGDPADRLWMTQTAYSNATVSWSWSDPVIIDGEQGGDGADGNDGSNAGLWTIWSDEANPDFNITDVPTLQPGGDYTFTEISSYPDWYDDVTTSTPKWMGTSTLNSTTGIFGAWQFAKIAGEQPPYMIDLYNRSETQPPNVTTDIPYFTGNELTTGAQAAALVNADGNSGWNDTPQAGTGRLWLIKLYLDNSASPNNAWSVPVEIDGDEGKSAGVWIVWSNNATSNKPIAPPPPSPVDGSIDLTGTDWYDDVNPGTDEPIWSASTYYNVGDDTWTTWRIAQIKGNDGLDATDQLSYIEVKFNGFMGVGPVPYVYSTLKNAVSEARQAQNSVDGKYSLLAPLWHSSNNNTPGTQPVVGSRLFEDDAGVTPYIPGGTTGGFMNTVNHSTEAPLNIIRVDSLGYVLAVYTIDEAAGLLPSAILQYTEEVFEPPYLGTSGTPYYTRDVLMEYGPPRLVMICIEARTNVSIGGKTYTAGTRISVPFQNESENNDLRNMQVSWRPHIALTDFYTFEVGGSTIKIFGSSTLSGTNGYWIDQNDWDLILQIYG